jgi:D-3-phosphoglycerate dehydrogenase
MTLGLVGLGNVGREVAARGRALGFTMLGYDPAPPGAIPPDVTMVALDDLLSRSDLVSVHARATAGNRHMFGAAAFGRMPRGSFFINTARESLVDEDALAGALANGTLAGAALDVAEPRHAGDRHPLLDLPNVIVTPHIGGATRETLRRGAEMAAAAVASVLSGGAPDHVLNPEALARHEVAR